MAAKWTIDVKRTDNGYYCDPDCLVPMQIRSPLSNLKVAELAAEMLRDGRQKDPVTVRRIHGAAHILDGNRRLAAIKHINISRPEGEKWKVWFVVQEVANELDALLTAATLNATMPMNPLDRAHLYSLALREGSLTQEALAERIGKTAAHVSQHLSLLKLGEVEQRAIADGRIGFSAALHLLGLSPASREQVVATVSASEKPMTGAEVKELTAQARNSAPEGAEDAPPTGGAGRRKLAMGLGKFREIMGALGEKDRVFGPLWNAMDGVLYGEISPDDFTEEWMEFVAKLHFDYLEELKKAGKIKGV